MAKADFAEAFGQSFQRFGFAMVKDHGMDMALIDQAWSTAHRFFALPVAVKEDYNAKFNGGQRGYTAFGTEIAKGATENDLKEFWHVGRDLPEGDPLAETMPPNVWPAEMPEFKPLFAKLYSEFDRVGAELLSAIALYLGLPERWFDGPIENGNSILRLQIGRAVQQECRDRSRMPSSA
eukprot:TRINITY_DN28438_c0_g1_i2.p2 TRINITY_DN28438_c0_g1~~TRINITY_DN28438_c0_g1_i2.p2  ORF type:complete len:179 (-),score=62.41 TRINITY_DN28438_c0_g1_i2:11-547(-)